MAALLHPGVVVDKVNMEDVVDQTLESKKTPVAATGTISMLVDTSKMQATKPTASVSASAVDEDVEMSAVDDLRHRMTDSMERVAHSMEHTTLALKRMTPTDEQAEQ